MKTTKYLLIAFVFTCLSIGQIYAQSNGLLQILDDLEEKDGVSTVLISKKMFELFAKTTDLEVEGESLNEVISTLDKLMIYEVDLPSAETNSIAKSITGLLQKDGYEVLIKIKEDGDDVEIYISEVNNIVKHLFLLSKDKSSLQIISLLGNIDLAKISKLSGTLNIDALELIDKE